MKKIKVFLNTLYIGVWVGEFEFLDTPQANQLIVFSRFSFKIDQVKHIFGPASNTSSLIECIANIEEDISTASMKSDLEIILKHRGLRKIIGG